MTALNKSLFLGVGLIVSVIAGNIPAFATSSTAFNLAKIEYHKGDSAQIQYNCLLSASGAIVNECGDNTVTLSFDLVINNPGVWTITALNYWAGTGSTGVSCRAWSYDGYGHASDSATQTFNAGGQEQLTFYSPYVEPAGSMTLICTVPPGQGLSLINWNQ
jgi:hypothetical protein